MIATEREWLSDRRQGIYATQESAFFSKISCDSHYMSPRFPVKVPTAITFEVMFRNTKINQTCTADCNRFTSKWPSRHPTYTLTNSYIFTSSQILPCSRNTQHTLLTNSYQQRLTSLNASGNTVFTSQLQFSYSSLCSKLWSPPSITFTSE